MWNANDDKTPFIVRCPLRMFVVLLLCLFCMELSIMIGLGCFTPYRPGFFTYLLYAILLTFAGAPLLWMFVVGPLRSMAVSEATKTAALLRNVVDGVVIFDDKGKIVLFNRAAERIFGLSGEESLGMPISALLVWPDAAGDNCAFIGAQGAFRQEMSGRHKNGSMIPLDVSVTKISLADVWENVAIIRDLSETKRTKARLHEANQRLSALIQASPHPIVAFDVKGTVDLWNRAAESLFGWRADEVIGGPYPAVPPEKRDEHMEMRNKVLEGYSYANKEVERLRKDNTRIPVSVSAAPVYDAGGGITGVMSVIVDIMEQRKAEEALRLMNRAMESSSNGVIITQPISGKLVITYVNQGFERITGYSRAEAMGRNPSFLLHSGASDEERKRLRETIIAEEGGTFILCNYRKDGKMFWNELSVAPVLDDSGRATHYVGIMNDISDRKKAEEQLLYVANHDALTGLPNRNLLQDRLSQALAYEEYRRAPICVMFLDLDNFKLVNDTWGHSMGDRLLVAVAERLQNIIRGGDTVARLGGDEFVIILPLVREVKDVVIVAQKIVSVFARPFVVEDKEFHITASIGITLFPSDGDTMDILLRNADAAMYDAKGNGKNTYKFYSPDMNKRIFERLELEGKLHHALKKNELVLYYQPRVDNQTGRVWSAEALVRWNHPEIGMIAPGRFIPLAEETGLIMPIGEWVLREACRQNKEWQQAGLRALRVAVNLSARQFRQQDLVKTVCDILLEADLDPRWLELEITESCIMDDVEYAVRTLTELKEMGIHLSLDDFGTGYSSLNHLKKFPLDCLKVDQSFIRDVLTDANDAAIVTAIIRMAEALNLDVIAEGVETAGQLAFLAAQGCREIQGYYFSRPLPSEAFMEFVVKAFGSSQDKPGTIGSAMSRY